MPPSRRRSSFFPLHRASADTAPSLSATNVPVLTASEKPPLRILVASWNVGNAMPPKNPHVISEWIPEGGGNFDVIAIGLQESSYREKAPSVGSEIGVPEATECGGGVTSDSVAVEVSDTKGADVAAEIGYTAESSSPTRRDTSRSEWESENGECCEDDDDDLDDDDLATALADARQAAREASASAIPSPSPSKSLARTEAGDEQDESAEAAALGRSQVSTSLPTGDVIVKRSRAKKSIRKVSNLVRQVSSNLRESVADALDYPFNKQLYHHLGESYGLVGKVELMEMRLFVYVHVRHTVSGVEKLSVPTGLGSVLGNKVCLVL